MGFATAGSRDTLVELRHRQLTTGDNGEQVESWPTAYASVWARWTELRGTKRLIAQANQHDQSVECQILWRSDILATDHVVVADTGDEHEIIDKALVGRREGLDLQLRRIVP